MIERSYPFPADRPLYPDDEGFVKCVYCRLLTDSCVCQLTGAGAKKEGISLKRQCAHFRIIAGGPDGESNPKL